jgi:hypothetical protein
MGQQQQPPSPGCHTPEDRGEQKERQGLVQVALSYPARGQEPGADSRRPEREEEQGYAPETSGAASPTGRRCRA